MHTDGFPKYFLVDNEVYVKVYFDNDVFVGINDLGNPAQPYKAMTDGREITQEEFDKGRIKRRQEFGTKIIDPTS